MATRRQEKVARVVAEAVSDAIANHLNDPRIEGFVSVTRVELAPDLRNAEVYLSVFGKDETSQKKTFIAIKHARTRVQSLLAGKIKSKFCPVLHFHMDEKFKKTLDVMNLIDRAVSDTNLQTNDDDDDDEYEIQ
ncbi:30S ribosome-binding factor RbfA [Planctomycetota bacterium]